MMQAIRCPNGHLDERYIPVSGYELHTPSRFCRKCGHPMWGEKSWPTPLLYFRENRAQYIENLDATIRSHGEHVRAMKERGVEPATDWYTSGKRSRL